MSGQRVGAWAMWETITGVALTVAAGALGWVFHLGNRVSVLETHYSHIATTLTRIEGKLDRA